MGGREGSDPGEGIAQHHRGAGPHHVQVGGNTGVARQFLWGGAAGTGRGLARGVRRTFLSTDGKINYWYVCFAFVQLFLLSEGGGATTAPGGFTQCCGAGSGGAEIILRIRSRIYLFNKL